MKPEISFVVGYLVGAAVGCLLAAIHPVSPRAWGIAGVWLLMQAGVVLVANKKGG